jgi:hypothetical protein
MTEAPQPSEASTLQGREPDISTPEHLAEAIEQAFDYRGDVTIGTTDGSVIEGYIFDRRTGIPTPYIRMMLPGGGGNVRVDYAQIARLVFSGRDTAAGKSWETWVKNYQQKKAKGENATIEPEKLED